MAEYSKEIIVEALLFASSEPVAAGKIAATAGITEDEVLEAIGSLNREYISCGRAFRILEIAGGYQFRTLPELADYVRSLGKQIASGRLSGAALETLAIIAYRQPVIRPEIEKIRGVNVTGVLKSLIEKKLVTVCGRAQVLGRPLLYGTTKGFLRYFGLADLEHLPRESELEVLLGGESGLEEPEEQTEEDKGAVGADEQQPLI